MANSKIKIPTIGPAGLPILDILWHGEHVAPSNAYRMWKNHLREFPGERWPAAVEYVTPESVRIKTVVLEAFFEVMEELKKEKEG